MAQAPTGTRIVRDPPSSVNLTVSDADPSFRRHLRATNKAPRTVQTYLDALSRFEQFLASTGMPRDVRAIRREHIESWLVALQDLGRSPASVANRYRSLQQFFRWLADEGEIAESPMARMRPPAVPLQPPPVLTDAELRALLKACEGTSFEDRRDMAIIRLLMDTGMRRAECAGLKVSDVDFDLEVALVMGKGRRGRSCPVGPQDRPGTHAICVFAHGIHRQRRSGCGSARRDGSGTPASSRCCGDAGARRAFPISMCTCFATPSRTDARRRDAGGRPDAHRRMAITRHAWTLRGIGRGRASPSRVSQALPGRSAVSERGSRRQWADWRSPVHYTVSVIPPDRERVDSDVPIEGRARLLDADRLAIQSNCNQCGVVLARHEYTEDGAYRVTFLHPSLRARPSRHPNGLRYFGPDLRAMAGRTPRRADRPTEISGGVYVECPRCQMS